MSNRARVALSAGDTPPKEFRIFTAGWNDTTKGRYLFDRKAAAMVMATYKAQGIERAIDLEHLSLDKDSPSYDPDARGWCKLELRGGELWAVGVSWTDDGAERLTSKKQRYVSPVFEFEKATKRVSAIYNIAICAVPATHETPALVAASQRSGAKYVTLSIEVRKMEDLKKIAVLLGLSEDASLEDIMNAIKAFQEAAADEPPKKDEEKKDEAAADEPDGDEAEMSALTALPAKLQGKVIAALASSKVLAKQIKDIQAKQTKSEIESLVAANVKKIPKALEAWALSTNVETLTAFLKDAPEQAEPAQERPRTPATEVVALTADDKKIARQAGLTDEQVIAHKKKLTAARNEEAKARQG